MADDVAEDYGEPWTVERIDCDYQGRLYPDDECRTEVTTKDGHTFEQDYATVRIADCVNFLAGVPSSALRDPLPLAAHLLLAVLRGDDTAAFALRDHWQECEPAAWREPPAVRAGDWVAIHNHAGFVGAGRVEFVLAGPEAEVYYGNAAPHYSVIYGASRAVFVRHQLRLLGHHTPVTPPPPAESPAGPGGAGNP